MQRQENIGQASEAHAYSELTAEQLAALSKEYEAASAKNDSLLEEVIFILNERIEEKKIKIHAVEGRIKKLESLIEKCKRSEERRVGEEGRIRGGGAHLHTT